MKHWYEARTGSETYVEFDVKVSQFRNQITRSRRDHPAYETECNS